MNQHKISHSLLRILLYTVSFLISISIGYGVAAALMQIQSGALQTLPFLICLLVSLCIQSCVHTVGHWLFGRISGFRLLAISFLRHSHVKEQNRFVTRQPLPESLLTTCLMAPIKPSSQTSYTFYWLGGSILNLMIGLISLMLMVLLRFSLDSWSGCFCFSLFQSGLWFAVLNGLPLYHGGLPNDGMKAVLFSRFPNQQKSWTTSLQIMQQLSQGHSSINEIPDAWLIPDQSARIDLFASMLLLHQYEVLVWKRQFNSAQKALLPLYENIASFPDEWQIRIWQECVYILSITSRDLSLADKMMPPDRVKHYEDMRCAEAYRCLWAWAFFVKKDAQSASSYLQSANQALSRTPFRYAADAWRRQLRLLAERGGVCQ